jgi:glycine betaine/proline transport system substrate-binding protein
MKAIKLVLVLFSLALLVGPARAGDAQDVKLGQISLSFYAVVGQVVQIALERLGHKVEVVQGTHGEMYPKLGSGEVELLAAAWLPNAHGPLHKPVADRVVEVTTLYKNARLYWAVPDYVPETEVRSIDDLKKPEVASKMDRRIVGIGPDSGLMRGAEQIVKDYGLEAAGYSIVTGPPADWIANFRQAVEQKRWVVMPLWQPQFLNRAYRVRILDEPKGIYGVDEAMLVANKTAWNHLPERTRKVLSRIELGLDAVTEMDYAVNVDKKSPRETAEMWMARNRFIVDAWFAGGPGSGQAENQSRALSFD